MIRFSGRNVNEQTKHRLFILPTNIMNGLGNKTIREEA